MAGETSSSCSAGVRRRRAGKETKNERREKAERDGITGQRAVLVARWRDQRWREREREAGERILRAGSPEG